MRVETLRGCSAHLIRGTIKGGGTCVRAAEKESADNTGGSVYCKPRVHQKLKTTEFKNHIAGLTPGAAHKSTFFLC